MGCLVKDSKWRHSTSLFLPTQQPQFISVVVVVLTTVWWVAMPPGISWVDWYDGSQIELLAAWGVLGCLPLRVKLASVGNQDTCLFLSTVQIFLLDLFSLQRNICVTGICSTLRKGYDRSLEGCMVYHGTKLQSHHLGDRGQECKTWRSLWNTQWDLISKTKLVERN